MTQAETNTGFARMKTLNIQRGSNSSSYNITNQFTYNGNTYAALTDTEFAQLNQQQYRDRLLSFVMYVYGLNDGLQEDCPDLTQGSEIYNVTLCPITQLGPEYEWSSIQ